MFQYSPNGVLACRWLIVLELEIHEVRAFHIRLRDQIYLSSGSSHSWLKILNMTIITPLAAESHSQPSCRDTVTFLTS